MKKGGGTYFYFILPTSLDEAPFYKEFYFWGGDLMEFHIIAKFSDFEND